MKSMQLTAVVSTALLFFAAPNSVCAEPVAAAAPDVTPAPKYPLPEAFKRQGTYLLRYRYE